MYISWAFPRTTPRVLCVSCDILIYGVGAMKSPVVVYHLARWIFSSFRSIEPIVSSLIVYKGGWLAGGCLFFAA